jgi:hypothetical protein
MRLLILLFVHLYCTTIAYTQWHDAQWFMGQEASDYPSSPGIDRVRMDFRDSLRFFFYEGQIPIGPTVASLCDSSGQLLTLSNGCYITNASEQEVPGSDGLSPGIMYDEFCLDGSGVNIPNAMLALPEPGNQHRIHFFHFPLVFEGNWFFHKHLLRTILDINPTTQAYTVVSKNEIIVADSIGGYGLQAVKHANGRDWWIVADKDSDNTYFISLLTPDTLITHSQQIGIEYEEQFFGEMVFSPDGSKLALYEVEEDLQLFDFDRCTGTFSNAQNIPIIDPDSIQYYAGAAWSADSRYVYCSTVKRIYQFDTQASDIAASKVLVATRNAGGCPINPTLSPVDLSYMELGPDGRIFCRGLSTYACIHVIQHPERAGIACQVDQGYYALGYGPGIGGWASKTIPNFPNFRLGAVDGSACDTLGLDNHPLSHWRYTQRDGAVAEFTSVAWYQPEQWWWDFGDPSSGAQNQSS